MAGRLYHYAELMAESGAIPQSKRDTASLSELEGWAARDYFATWMPPIRCTPGSSHVFNLFIPVPAGTVYTIMDRVTIQVNGLPVDIHGQYCTAEEKAQRLQRPSR